MKKPQFPQMALLIAALSIGSAGIPSNAFARGAGAGDGHGRGGHSHGSSVSNSDTRSGGSADATGQGSGRPAEAVRTDNVAPPPGSAAGPDDPNDFPSVW